MSKCLKFTDKDNELIKKITEYQTKNDIQSFTEAVRKLCKKALKIEEAMALTEE